MNCLPDPTSRTPLLDSERFQEDIVKDIAKALETTEHPIQRHKHTCAAISQRFKNPDHTIMPIELRLLQPSDLLAEERVMDAAFGVDGLTPYIFPNGKTQEDKIHRLRDRLETINTGISHSDDQAGHRIMIAYDTEGTAPDGDHGFPVEFTHHQLPEADRATWGKIVGIASWTLQPVLRTEEDIAKEKEEAKKKEGSLPPSANAELLAAFRTALDNSQAKHMGGKPFVFLKILAVDPEMQRKGVGKKMLNWGLEIADRLNLPTYLEASAAGTRLYHANGFEDLGLLEGFDLTDFGAPENKTFMCMVRPAQGKH